MTHDLKSNCV